MSQYLLDTNICIHWSKDEFNLRQKVRQVGVENCFLSELTIAELIYGIAKSAPSKQAANRHSLGILQQLFAGRMLLVGTCFEVYGAEKVRLRALGRPVDDFDLLIGSTALAHGLTLVTRNTRHFTNLLGLALEDWTIPPAPAERPRPPRWVDTGAALVASLQIVFLPAPAQLPQRA